MNYLRFWSVVLLEDDESSILICIMKMADIFRIGSLELVDRLIIISNGEDIWTLDPDRCYAIHESHLGIVGILEFIDHDELILFCEAHTDDIILFDELDRLQDHIGEVDESAFGERFLIGFVDLSECLLFREFSLFFEYSFSLHRPLSPTISPTIHELRTPISCICLPGFSETLIEYCMEWIIRKMSTQRFKSSMFRILRSINDSFFVQLSNHICEFFEELDFFFFVFFLLTEYIDLTPVLFYEWLEIEQCLRICLQDLSIEWWSDSSFLQVSNRSENILDRLTRTESWLVGVIPRKSREDLIEDPRGFDRIDRFGFIILFRQSAESVQYLIPEAMEGMDRYTICILSDHARESLTHIACSILSEGETEDIGREIVCREEYIRDTSGEELSLPASRSCDHEDRSVDRLDGFELAIIQGSEYVSKWWHKNLLSVWKMI